jgi:hypothetical protein
MIYGYSDVFPQITNQYAISSPNYAYYPAHKNSSNKTKKRKSNFNSRKGYVSQVRTAENAGQDVLSEQIVENIKIGFNNFSPFNC